MQITLILFVAISLLTSLGLYLFNKYLDKKHENFQVMLSLMSKLLLKSSISERISKVEEITQKQLELSSIVDMPQKNALDGKYKNSLIREIADLEEEKNNILRSILQDNVDPYITIIDENYELKTIKLSEYMSSKSPKSSESKLNDKNPRPRFIVYDGGKKSEDE